MPMVSYLALRNFYSIFSACNLHFSLYSNRLKFIRDINIIRFFHVNYPWLSSSSNISMLFLGEKVDGGKEWMVVNNPMLIHERIEQWLELTLD